MKKVLIALLGCTLASCALQGGAPLPASGSAMKQPRGNVEKMVGLQTEIAGELAATIPEQWDRILVHYEHFFWEGDLMNQYVAKYFVGTADTQFYLSPEVLDKLAELHAATPAKSRETWTRVRIEVKKDGVWRFDFKYDAMPPFADILVNSRLPEHPIDVR